MKGKFFLGKIYNTIYIIYIYNIYYNVIVYF